MLALENFADCLKVDRPLMHIGRRPPSDLVVVQTCWEAGIGTANMLFNMTAFVSAPIIADHLDGAGIPLVNLLDFSVVPTGLRNSDAAAEARRRKLPDSHPFAAFRACKASADLCKGNSCQTGKDWTFRGSTLPEPSKMQITFEAGDLAASAYGFRTGQGHGGSARVTLDLGHRYSIDRCALAHDGHYWSSESTANDVGLLACFDRVYGMTEDERKAVEGSYYGILYKIADDLELVEGASLSLDQASKEDLVKRVITFVVETSRSRNNMCFDISKAGSLPAAGRIERMISCETRECAAGIRSGEECGPVAEAQPTPTSRVLVYGEWVWRLASDDGYDDADAFVVEFARLNPEVNPDLVYAGRSYQFPPEA